MTDLFFQEFFNIFNEYSAIFMASIVPEQLAFEKHLFLRTYRGYIRKSKISIQQLKISHVFINIFRTVDDMKK